MKFGLSKSRLMLLQVLVLAVSVINDVTFSHPLPPSPSPAPAHPPSQHHHHHHGPAHSPVKPPAHPPLVKPPAHPPAAHPPVVKPPMPSPAHPPVKPTPAPIRSFIAVQGVVYCESCNYTGKDTLIAAKPISGAVVKLACNNTKYAVVVKAKTDKKGYFFIIAPKTITNYAFHKCKVFLVYSPVPNCKKPANLNAGFTGAPLKPYKPLLINNLPFTLYSVGPFAFEPKCPRFTPHTHL